LRWQSVADERRARCGVVTMTDGLVLLVVANVVVVVVGCVKLWKLSGRGEEEQQEEEALIQVR
jgi:hypothetical protein